MPEGTQADAVGRDLAGPGSCAGVADRPLGRRVAAALVDLGVLAGLYVIMSLIVGSTSPWIGPLGVNLFAFTITTSGGGVFSIGFSGAWAALYLILLPGYYFVLETLAGQTAGKALLGLRVLRSGGARPTAGAIALVRWCGSLTGCRRSTWPGSSSCCSPADGAVSGSATWPATRSWSARPGHRGPWRWQ
jgi:RDD family